MSAASGLGMPLPTNLVWVSWLVEARLVELKTVGSTWAHLRGPGPPGRVERAAGSEPPRNEVCISVEPRRAAADPSSTTRTGKTHAVTPPGVLAAGSTIVAHKHLVNLSALDMTLRWIDAPPAPAGLEMRRVLITTRCALVVVLCASLSRAPLKVGPTAQTVREGLLVRAGLRNHREPGTGLNDRLQR
ncbi:hypothetical protein PMIN01_08725 [Paraphaeosphaeria minitans]|uniref:Uncharacterized protein n=1 Tax=Paraphaeosphaeria minitans TaxID=565426 RepID=A0A9P6KMZ0_9PLEO|nr:hypothetical protein PMIN01_08725 [Paraphaeosphaeria minitans]